MEKELLELDKQKQKLENQISEITEFLNSPEMPGIIIIFD